MLNKQTSYPVPCLKKTDQKTRLQKLRELLEIEWVKSKTSHWSYDINHHKALAFAYQQEKE